MELTFFIADNPQFFFFVLYALISGDLHGGRLHRGKLDWSMGNRFHIAATSATSTTLRLSPRCHWHVCKFLTSYLPHWIQVS